MTDTLSKLKAAKDALSEAIAAIELMGYLPVPGAEGYFYSGIKIRHRMKDGRYKDIKLVHNRFSAHRRAYYVSANGGEPVLCKQSKIN